MNRILYTVIISVIFAAVIYPQNNWLPKNLSSKNKYFDTTFSIIINKRNSKIFIRYQEYLIPEGKTNIEDTYYFRAELRKNINDKPFQVIESNSTYLEGPLAFVPTDSGDGQITIDMNFDGYNDLRFTKSSGYGPFWTNISYEFYLYNPKNGKFEYNDDLSNLINPEPYPDQKKIYCYSKMNFIGTNSFNEEFEWSGNKLEEMASYEYNVYEDSLLQDGTCCKCLCIKKSFENGKSVKTDTTIIDVKNIPKEHFIVY